MRYITIFRYIDTVIGCIDIILRLSVLRYINILVYCPSSSVLCELELDQRNVNVDKLLFLCENLRQLPSCSFKTCWTYPCSSGYWFSNNHIGIAIQQYIVNILHAIRNMPICHIVTALPHRRCSLGWDYAPTKVPEMIISTTKQK